MLASGSSIRVIIGNRVYLDLVRGGMKVGAGDASRRGGVIPSRARWVGKVVEGKPPSAENRRSSWDACVGEIVFVTGFAKNGSGAQEKQN